MITTTRLGMGSILMVASLVWVALAGSAPAQTMGLGAPMTVRFTGTFTPWAEGQPEGPDHLTVHVGTKKLSFHVTDVASYEGSDPSRMLLSHIFPPMLTFVGPKHRLEAVEAAAGGEKLAVEGWLYAGDNMFYVAAVKPAGD